MELALLYVKPHVVSGGAEPEIRVFLERNGFILFENRRVVVTPDLAPFLGGATGEDPASLLGSGIFYTLASQAGDTKAHLEAAVGEIGQLGTLRGMYGVTDQFNAVFPVYKPLFDEIYVQLEVWNRHLRNTVEAGLEAPLAEAAKRMGLTEPEFDEIYVQPEPEPVGEKEQEEKEKEE